MPHKQRKKGESRGTGRLARLLIAALVAGLWTRPVSAQAPPVVPTFVDPHVHLDKPDLSGLRGVRFLTSDDDPPFTFTSPDGTLAGFNVDLARAICGVLAISCSIQVQRFEALVPTLKANGGDAVIASLAMTATSRREVDFSLATMKTPARFVARTGGTPGAILPETIGGMRVGVQSGTAHAAYLSAFFPAAVIRPYPDPDSLRAALTTGAVDLIFADGLATALWLNGTAAAHCCQFAGGPFTESRYFGEGTGLAVRKGDAVLKQAFDYALQQLTSTGVTADLYLKYFPIGFY